MKNINQSDRIKLVKLSTFYKDQLFDMMDEWMKDNKANYVPWAIFKNDYHDFDHYLEELDIKVPTEGKVIDDTFFALHLEKNIFIGAVNIRHTLNDKLLFNGGHIGDGIRPSERNKGYGTEMIKLALTECQKLGIKNVLMVCDKDNVSSSKTIQNNGGILENELDDNGTIIQRYWINLN